MRNSQPKTSLQADIKKSTHHLLLATSAWVASTFVMSFGPSYLWDYHPLLTSVAIFFNLLLGTTMLYSFFKHLNSMDELQRQTHFEAMALTLGITMILTVIYGALPQARLLVETQVSNVLFVIGVSYALSVTTLWLRRTYA